MHQDMEETEMTEPRSEALGGRVLDARRDSTDFRDHVYRPALVQLPRDLPPKPEHLNVRNQGQEGACTGFGLAAVVDYLNGLRIEEGILDEPWEPVSSRMLYELAKRHDRWPGEEYEGSSARGAMKGWHKYGVCPDPLWPYRVGEPGFLTAERQERALRYPLGAYYRVMPRRSEAQAALVEAHVLFVTAKVHPGWNDPTDGAIPYRPGEPETGGHAFAVVGYTEDGFIVQNSWGTGWGGLDVGGHRLGGLALWSYEDFEAHLMDAWVARMALPVRSLASLRAGNISQSPRGPERIEAGPPQHEIAHHYIHIDDGQFDPQGDYPSKPEQVDEIVQRAVQAEDVVLYAHGGLNSVKAAAARTGAWREVFERNGIHEVHFIWESGLLGELRDVLFGKQDFAEERAGGFLSGWWDRLLEKASHPLGRPLWAEMISDAEVAFAKGGNGSTPAGTETLDRLITALAGAGGRTPRLHLVGHSAGSIWLAHLLARWKDLGGPPIQNLIFLAPAATHALYADLIRPRMRDRTVEELTLFRLSEDDEKRDTVQQIYRKSLLYLVSNSYQKTKHQLEGPSVPLIGMHRFQEEFEPLTEGYKRRATVYVTDEDPETTSSTHGGFDNDLATMNTVLRLVLGDRYGQAEPFTEEELE